MKCPYKIRPFPNNTEIQCELTYEHDQHSGVLRDYAYPGSATEVNWSNTDRRNFAGDWIDCPSFGCILPGGHDGNHAI